MHEEQGPPKLFGRIPGVWVFWAQWVVMAAALGAVVSPDAEFRPFAYQAWEFVALVVVLACWGGGLAYTGALIDRLGKADRENAEMRQHAEKQAEELVWAREQAARAEKELVALLAAEKSGAG
jgi:hypothetical protein